MFSLLKRIKEAGRPRCAAVVAAAGSSSRMAGVNKMMAALDGIPVLARTLMALQQAQCVDEIVVATKEENLVEVSHLCRTYGITKCTKVICGGADRVHSVMMAVTEVSKDMELVAVQDGARPLVTPGLIDRVIMAAQRCGAAAPAVPVKDTIKEVDENSAVTKTLVRQTLRAVQTPQVFTKDLLKAALQSAIDENAAITDDCSAVERLGKVVYLVEGEEENLKITTQMDLVLAEAILRNREGE